MHEEEKVLATDRLLEILRADAEEDVEEREVSIPLSEKEVQAILATKDSKKEKKKKRGFSIPKEKIDYKKFLNFTLSKLKRLVIEKDGYIGLDIGNNNIKYVILKHSGKDIILKGYGIHSYRNWNLSQEKMQEELLHTLGLAITSEKKKLYNIVTSVFGQKVAIKNVTLPKVAKAELRDAIIWNAKKDLPFPIEQSMVDFKILGEISEKGVPKLSSVIAIADQEIIQTHLELLKKMDTIPSRVVIVPLAIYNTFYFFTEKNQIKNGVVIDIGSSNTYMIFISEGNLQFAREIGIGGEDITQGLIGSISTDKGVINIDREFAEKLKIDVGIADENNFALYKEGISNSQVGMMMKPTLEKLASQIQRTFDYYRSKFPKSDPEKVYISGGTASMKNFAPFLTEALGREVLVLNPFEYVKVSDKISNKEDLDKAAPFLSVAFGNAIDERRGLNLLPPEIQIIPLLNFQKKIFIRAFILIAFILSIFSLNIISGKSEYKDRLESMNVHGKSAVSVLQEYKKLNSEKAAVENERNNFMAQVRDISGEVDIVGVMKILSSVTPNYITINNVSIENKNVIFDGYINNPEFNSEIYIADFGVKIERTGFFMKVEPYREISPEGGSESLNFEISRIVE